MNELVVQKKFIQVLKDIYSRASVWLRLRFYFVLIAATIVSFSQLAVVATVALLGAALVSPESIALSDKLPILRTVLPAEIMSDSRLFLVFLSCACFMAVVCCNGLRAFYEYYSVRIMAQVRKEFGVMMIRNFFSNSYEWHMNQNSADLVLANQWSAQYGILAKNLVTIFCDLLSATMVVAAVMILDPLLAIAILGTIGLIAIGLFTFLKSQLDKHSFTVTQLTMAQHRIVNMALQGIRDVRLFSRETDLTQKYERNMAKTVTSFAKQELARSTPVLCLEMLGFGMICLTIMYMLLFKGTANATVAGTVTLIAASGWRILPSVTKILASATSIRTCWPYIQKTETYYESRTAEGAPARLDANPTQSTIDFTEAIRFKGVSFKYREALDYSLKKIDVTITKGQSIGIIGKSGAGKSTLVNILSGLLTPEGEVFADDRLLGEDEIRRFQAAQVGYVPQAPFIFDGTLAKNIAFTLQEEDIDKKHVLKCCRMAAIDYLDSLPRGIDTMIGERGALLSGGQQQRVAIARALYKRPNVLIFDEATSALDGENEKAIQRTINDFKGKLTLVIVAHRLSTIAECDVIYWIDGGTVRMAGKPSDVLQAYSDSGQSG